MAKLMGNKAEQKKILDRLIAIDPKSDAAKQFTEDIQPAFLASTNVWMVLPSNSRKLLKSVRERSSLFAVVQSG
ncbi:hypothetical protein [Shimazuella alba]|uniref:Uncharacterized protein n=1 Tax=Shimazuella alba TaxID=2690964 RepID=A0A6I4VY09_9BACL|nr:hypothetical protein [Shimazuella alba]MXQ54855.1 hypothetical protein [Shimazuella alba]